MSVGNVLTMHGDRSRAWSIHDGAQRFVAKVTFDGPGYVEPGLEIAAVVDAARLRSG